MSRIGLTGWQAWPSRRGKIYVPFGILLPLALGVTFLFGTIACQGNPSDYQPNTPQNEGTEHSTSTMKDTIAYLALGDSYTIGESVAEADRWPVVLGEALKEAGYSLEELKIIATTGWTTAELNEGIASANVDRKYNLVSLLIGVNNQYRGPGRGYTLDGYRTEFEDLLQQAIDFAGSDTSRVFVVSIPDYGVTPFVTNDADRERIGQELDAYNAAAKAICDSHGVKYYDITPISREAANDLELVATDNLHPSGKMYRRWVNEVIVPDFILPLE